MLARGFPTHPGEGGHERQARAGVSHRLVRLTRLAGSQVPRFLVFTGLMRRKLSVLRTYTRGNAGLICTIPTTLIDNVSL